MPLQPPVPALQKPPPMPATTVRRGRGRPPGSSYPRHQSPSTFKASPRTPTPSPEELAQFYRNMVTLQMMNQSNSSPSANPLMNPSLINQAQQMMIGNAARALTQQLTLQTEMYRQQLMIQQKAQMQAMKDQTKSTSAITPQPSKDTSAFKAGALLAPSKVSVFSSQSVLLQNQQSKPTSKPQSNTNTNPQKSSSNAGNYQHGTQPKFPQSRMTTPSVRQPPKTSPFQQKVLTDPNVSLQHKLLSAKISKSQTTMTPIAKPQSSASNILDKNKPIKDKLASQVSTSLPTAALSSRGVSITPAKPPEIKIPKDITLGRSLSISPAGSSKNKSSLSPSISKDLTVTVLKSQVDAKKAKPNNTISVSIIDSAKKSQLSPGGEKQPPPTLRMGGAISITPAKPAKAPQVKPIPKADFSITLANNNENKKKDENNVIVID